MQVVVMLRKGGKATTAKDSFVSADIMLGEQLLAREKMEQRERTRMKQLTLETGGGGGGADRSSPVAP